MFFSVAKIVREPKWHGKCHKGNLNGQIYILSQYINRSERLWSHPCDGQLILGAT
jgi:hypothetical protein